MAKIKCFGCDSIFNINDIYTSRRNPYLPLKCPCCNSPFVNEEFTLPSGLILEGKEISYTIESKIGNGGSSIVYKATGSNGIKYAIKELYPDGYTRDNKVEFELRLGEKYKKYFKLFDQEFEMICHLNSYSIPGIVKAYEKISANGTVYIVMEYLEGQSLNTHISLNNNNLTIKETLTYMKPIVSVLDKCKELGYVHCDVNPNNIQVCSDNRWVLLDFGIAKENSSAETTMAGTDGYAPNDSERTHAYDVYGLAGTFFYCLTGCVPDITNCNQKWLSKNGVKIKPYQIKTLRRALEADLSLRTSSVKQFYKEMHHKYDPKITKAIFLTTIVVCSTFALLFGYRKLCEKQKYEHLMVAREQMNSISPDAFFCGRWIANHPWGQQSSAILTLGENNVYTYVFYAERTQEASIQGTPSFISIGLYEIEQQIDENHYRLKIYNDDAEYEGTWDITSIDGKLFISNNCKIDDADKATHYKEMKDALFIPCVSETKNSYSINFYDPKTLKIVNNLLDLSDNYSYSYVVGDSYYSNQYAQTVIPYTVMLNSVTIAEAEISLNYFDLKSKNIYAPIYTNTANLNTVSSDSDLLGNWICQSDTADNCTGVLTLNQNNTFSLQFCFRKMYGGEIPNEFQETISGYYNVSEESSSNLLVVKFYNESYNYLQTCNLNLVDGVMVFQAWNTSDIHGPDYFKYFNNNCFIPCCITDNKCYIDYMAPRIVKIVATRLCIPDDIEYTYSIGNVYYDEAGQEERLHYSFGEKGGYIAGATVSASSLIPTREIYVYTPSSDQ